MTDEKRKTVGTTDEYMAIEKSLILEFCKYFPSHSEGRVFWAILLQVYDDYRMENDISLKTLEKITGLSRQGIVYALQNLEASRLIEIERNAGNINKISIQQDTSRWVVNKKAESFLKHRQREGERYRQRIINQLQKDLKK
jgi:hypothetical protein